MIILGVSNTKDSGAALIVDNAIVAVANEERFTREKLVRRFPEESLTYVLREGGISFDDVDVITTGAWKGLATDDVLLNLVEDIIFNVEREPTSKQLILDRFRVAIDRDREFKSELVTELEQRGAVHKLYCVDHHLAHASAAHHCSPFETSLSIVVDGRGDFKSNSVYRVVNNELQLVDTSNFLNSLGVVYGFVTRFLGFTPDKHEGKITGLAAYGEPLQTKHIFHKMVSIDDGGRIRANVGDYYSPFLTAAIPVVEKELNDYSREDIAAGVQSWLEEMVVAYVGTHLKQHDMGNLCLAGGIFANVKVNQRVREIDGVENVYVHQHMGDGGMSLGSALHYLYTHKGSIDKPLHDVFLGPAYSNHQIEETLKKHRDDIVYQKVDDIERVAAELVSDEKVVGWFQGRMEYGPRALCNRSILVTAKDNAINQTLNNRLSRTEFMPFAPVTLDEHAATQYREWKAEHIASRFMTICYDVHAGVADHSAAIVHVDGTARPQVIRPSDNPKMHKLLTLYHEMTGIPTVVNTSFNNHEEPIVCTPDDALESLLRDNVDTLCIGDFVVNVK